MKQYIIDELRLEDYTKLNDYFKEHFEAASLPGIYRVNLTKDLLTNLQLSHDECGPFYFALELSENCVICEFLVRSENKIRCSCIAYANDLQRNWLINLIDSVLEKLEIIT